MGRVTAWIRDLQGRVTTKINPDLTQITSAYEANTSRLKSVTDARNQTTLYSYFIDNNLKQVTYSNAVVATPGVSFTYDTNYNRLLTMTDGIGTTAYSYYAVTNGQMGAGLLASVDGSFANDTITYGYDALGRITSRAINGVGQSAGYDALGRVTVWTNALGSFTNVYVGATGLIATNYAPFGKKTIFSYLDNTHDQRLQTIWNQNVDGSTLSKFDYGYDALGNITNWTQQVDNTATNVWLPQYDPVNQLLAVTVRGNTIAGAILKQYAYGYDLAGNRTSEQIGNGTGASPVAISQSSYNNANQLTARTGGSGQMQFAGSLDEPGTVTVNTNAAVMNNFTTNFVGYASVTNGTNVIPVTATDYSNNSRTNKYQVVVTNTVGSQTLAFDLNGNMTNDGAGISYEYDAANRTTAINRGTTNRTEFAYDGAGRRAQVIEKTNGVAMSTNKYVWCGTELCEQRDNTGGTVTKRFFGEGEQINGTNYYFTRDHLGSIREMVDGVGVIQVRYDYDPYGNRKKISGTMDADFGFTGHFMLASQPETTFTLYRLYRADLGRWNSRDPMAETAGLNLYAYVGNNPINDFDPLGLWAYFQPSTWFDGKGYQPGSWEDLNGQVAQAILDGLNPFGNFFMNHGGYDPCDPALKTSRQFASIAGSAYLMRIPMPGFSAGGNSVIWSRSGEALAQASGRTMVSATPLGQYIQPIVNVLARGIGEKAANWIGYNVLWRGASAIYAGNATGVVPAFIPAGAGSIARMEIAIVRFLGNATIR